MTDTNNDEKSSSLPPTDMLYMTYEGNWLEECTATVLAVESPSTDSSKNADDDNNANKQCSIVLDRTVLHAQGGGQPTDKGILRCRPNEQKTSDISVHKVTMDRETGITSHAVSVTDDTALPVAGDTVDVLVDLPTRRILSECHSAGHVVDSAMAMAGKFLKPSKAYHFLEGPYVEYEGSIPPTEKEALLEKLQSAFCQLVDQDIDTDIQLMNQADADALCNRQAQNFDMNVFADKRTGQVRVVTVAGYPCPCGGTHIRSTKDLKENDWGIVGLKSKKGVVRVKYGQNANQKKK